MPLNTTGGKRNKKQKTLPVKLNVPYAKPEQDQMYAVAIQMLGNRHFEALCADGKKRHAIIPGKFRGQRYWVNKGTIVLINLRNWEKEEHAKVDVIYVYQVEEKHDLIRKKELPFILISERSEKEQDDEIDFTEDEQFDIDDL